MRLAAFQPSCGGGVIYLQLLQGFKQLGIKLEDYKPGEQYDYVLVFNNSAHIDGYNFDGIDTIKGKFAFIDTSEYGWWTHNKHYAERYYNAFAPGTIEQKPLVQKQLLDFLRGKSYPYFIREYYTTIPYHKNYHPIDYPLYDMSRRPEPPLASYDEFSSRPLDLLIAWGESSQTKKHIAKEVRNLTALTPDLKCIIISGDDKLPPDEYFKTLESARMSVSCDGYGSGGFRDTEILSRCTLLINNNRSMQQAHPLTNQENCIHYDVTETFSKGHFVLRGGIDTVCPIFTSTDITGVISHYYKDVPALYRIYTAGYQYCMKHLTEKAWAEYVLYKIQTHDWNEITPE